MPGLGLDLVEDRALISTTTPNSAPPSPMPTKVSCSMCSGATRACSFVPTNWPRRGISSPPYSMNWIPAANCRTATRSEAKVPRKPLRSGSVQALTAEHPGQCGSHPLRPGRVGRGQPDAHRRVRQGHGDIARQFARRIRLATVAKPGRHGIVVVLSTGGLGAHPVGIARHDATTVIATGWNHYPGIGLGRFHLDHQAAHGAGVKRRI